MFKLLIIAGLAALVQGYGYGGGYGGGSSYGGGGYGGGVIPIAIQSNHRIDYYNVPSSGYTKPITIDVGAQVIPVNVLFRSKSSYLTVEQLHEGQKGSVQENASQDEPHFLKHLVKKPIIQEVREVLVPLRRITQEVRPVQEDIQTIVARNSGLASTGSLISSGGLGDGFGFGGALGSSLGKSLISNMGGSYGGGYGGKFSIGGYGKY